MLWARCEACARTTQVAVSWTRANSGFTHLIEALIVTLCQAMPIRQVVQLLAVSDMLLCRTPDDYVEGARVLENVAAAATVGLEETAARRGHHHIGPFHDLGSASFCLQGRRVCGAVILNRRG